MAQYRLPDGRILNVDDDITQENAIILQNKLSELYPDYYQPYKEEVKQTFAGHTEELAKGIPRGLLGTFISAGEGVANLFSTGNDSAASKYFQDLQEELNKSSLGVDEGYEEAFSGKLGAGLGSFASFFIPGTVAGKIAGVTGKGLSAKEKLNRAQKFATRGALTTAIPVGIAEQGRNIQAAKDLGETVNAGQEIASEILGGAIGATEIYSLQRLFRYIPKGYKERLSIPQKLTEAVKTGTAEAFQESLAGIAQDAVALGIYSDELPMADSLFDDFTVGGSVGFISDLALRGVLGKRSIGNEYIKELEVEARKLIEEQRFQARKDFRLAELADQPLGLPLIDSLPESTLQLKDVPIMEEFEIITNPNGTSSIVGINTGTDYGVFENVEDAAKQATVLRKELRNDFIDTAVKHNLSVNGLYGNGTAYVLGRKLYDPDANLLPAQVVAALDSTISFKRAEKAQKIIEAETQLDSAIINDLMGEATLEEGYIEKLQEQINRSKTSYPIQPKDIDASSLLGQLYAKVKKKNIPVKYFYTPQEAKQILSAKDFNDLMSEKAAIKFRTRPRRKSEDIYNKSRIIDSSKENLDKVFEQKNIEVDYNSPAFQYLAEKITGAKKLGAMNKGQKELLVTEVLKLPRFNIKTPLPDYTPRPYNVNDLNNLYTDYKGQRITNAEIKAFVKKANDGSDLSPKQLNQLKEDLINSGRARKEKNRLIMNDNFELEQGKRAQSLNETSAEFATRLSETTPLTQDEIADIVERNAYEESEQVSEQNILEEQAFDSAKKYANLIEVSRQRLNELGLKDIGLKLEDRIKSSTGVQKVGGTYVFNQEVGASAEYDEAMKNVLIAMEKIDPDGTKTDAQLEEDIAGLIDHESIHALRSLDLLTQAEYKNLLAFAKNKLKTIKVEFEGRTITEAQRIDNLYRGDAQTVIDEEYVAELFRIYRNNPDAIKGKPRTTIRKIIDFFKGFFDAIFGTGFSSPIGVLEDISAGVVGKRERDVIRSSRNTESILPTPLFSRAATETDPPYMDFNRTQISNFSSNKVGFNDGVEIPLTHVTRMQVDDFLKLTTTGKNQINEIIEEGPLSRGIRQQGAVFDPEIADDEATASTSSLPSLLIQGDGRVIAHEGRHRVALIGQGGGRTIPVFIHFPQGRVEQDIPNPSGQTLQQQGVTSLKNQFQELVRDKYDDFVINEFNDFIVPISKLGAIAPLHRDSPQTNEKLNYAVEVATQPDTLAPIGNIPLFSIDGQATFPRFNKEGDELAKRISEAESDVYTASSILQQEGSLVSNATYKKMRDNLNRAEQRLAQLKALQKSSPRYMRTGVAPKDMLFPGEIETALVNTFKQTNGNPTAKDFKAVLKAFAPRTKKDHDLVDYADLKADFKEAMESGIDHLWYEKWGVNIPNLVGSVNMNEFSGVFGVTSGQATPEKNLKDTLRTMIIARQINPENNPKEFVAELKRFRVGKNDPQRHKDILKIYETGIFQRAGTGQKTATYALEIMESANNSFTPFSVIDRHMLRKFGIDEKAATPQEYRLVQGILALLATDTHNINGERRKFDNPRQIQAALWGHQRYGGPTKITNKGSYQSSVKFSQKEIKEINDMIQDGSYSLDTSFSNKFIHAPRYRSNTKSNVFDTNLGRNMVEAMLNKVPATIIEFKMGTERGYLPKRLEKSLPFSTFNNYQDQVLKKLTRGNQLKFLANLGIPHDITRSAGTWDTYLNPNILIKYPGVEPRTIRAVTQVMTDALMQDAAYISRPVSGGKLSTGLLVEKLDTRNFTVDELQELNDDFSAIQRAGQPVSFTLVPSNRTGLTLLDPLSFVEGYVYTKEDVNNFLDTIVPVLKNRGYTVKRYANESEYIEYGEQKDYTAGTRQAIRGLRDRGGVLESSDLQRTIIRDLYLPAYESYRQFAKEVGFEPNPVPPYLQENSALAGEADIIDYDIAEIQREAEVRAESMSVGNIPRYNVNANPVALKIAFDLEANPNLDIPPIPRRFNRDAAPVPPEYQETVNKIGGVNQPAESFAESIVKVSEYPDLIGKLLSRARVNYIDKLSDAEKGTLQSAELSPIVAELQNLADTSGIKALRLSERARGILAEMLMRGVPVFSSLDNINLSPELRAYIEKQDDITYGVTSVEDFEHGGIIQIFAPLYENPNVNLEQLFKIYAIAQRGTRLNKEGKETPVDEDTIAKAEKIKEDYPVVEQVYNQFQQFNNKVIDYAVDAGILSLVRTDGELIQDIVSRSDFKTSELQDLEYDQLIVLAKELNLNLDADNQIETRGTAQIWKDNSDYYPFYRQMSDESIGGPRIASGFVAGNPLNIKLKGSEAAIEPAPLEAITNNLLAIVTASMKNDGLRKMMREHQESGLATILDKPESGADVITVFLNGQKTYYRVADPLMINGLEAIGMNDTGELMKYLAMPASFLREMVTRDPGFMLVNVFRDTLSSYVTSGANYKPFIDQIKAINADLSELKRFGILGGYDYSNDPMSIDSYIKKELKKMGVGENGSYDAATAFTKLWDYLGQATTRSDALTRKAVADKVFELTGSQAEAAYQALEVINFGRRGASPVFRIITAAIPFLNARLQGLDVLYRAHTGRYSAVRVEGETREDVALNTALATLGRGGLLALLTGLYYALVSDDEEYTNANRNVRDDNWIIPLAEGIPALKLPIPFEVGVLYKVIPERVIDTALGGDINETYKTLQRQAITTLKVDPLGFQVVKPIMEVINNRSSYTGEAIVPYYMEKGLEAGLQSRYSTNELARVIGESLNISPIKLEYIMSGYGGTIGGYILGLADATTRAVTDRDYITPRIDKAPFLKRFLQTELGGGLQQQFYELREESDRFQQTVNALKRDGRFDELQAYIKNKSGLARTRPQLLALERYMTHWRKQRDRVLYSKLITPEQKKEIIEDMEVQRDIRLAFVPELREQSDIPFFSLDI